jgi:hypothetical protein
LLQKYAYICNMNKVSKNKQAIECQIETSICGHGRGWIFTRSDFIQFGSTYSIGMALMRLSRKGLIRQLARGLYDYPVEHPTLGRIAASTDAVAKALTRRDAVRLQPAGAYAANILGLSEQVPTKVIFLTDGPSRKVKLGKREIILKRTTPKNIAAAGRISGTVIQALRYMGQRHVDEQVLAILRRQLTDKDKAQLLKDIKFAPAWIAAIFRRLSSNAPK